MGAKILIIEDDPISARLMEYALQAEGYQVVIASDGMEGLAKATKESPNMLILDVMLPGLDGFELCSRLRADPQTADIPILMMSAKAQPSDMSTGKRMGASHYLVKPADPTEVLAVVENLLAERNA